MRKRAILKENDPEFVYIRDSSEYSETDACVTYIDTTIQDGSAQHKMLYTSIRGAKVWFIPCSSDFKRRIEEGEFKNLPEYMF